MIQTTTHSDVEALAALADGRLEGEDLESVVDHLSSCEQCGSVIRDVIAFQRESRRPSYNKWAAAAAIVLAVSVGSVELRQPISAWRYRSTVEPLIVAFQSGGRPIEPRLAGFRWSAPQSNTRSESLDIRLRIASGEIINRFRDTRSVNGQHASGIARLTIGDTQDAIAELHAAMTSSPRDASAWNDLAAAHYVAAVRFPRPDELRIALDMVDRALQIDKGLAEARFNRALILERMGRHAEAENAWRQFLALDHRSGWAAEARQHLGTIPGQP
jgi:tetratricopeptide (TPR) repeat protein